MTNTQKQLINNLKSQGLGYKAIASRLGLSPNTVKSHLRKHSQDFQRTDEVKANASFCLFCGKEVSRTLHKKQRKFCCDACRYAWWNGHRDRITPKTQRELTCRFCGRTFKSYGKRHYCSHECYIKDRFGK